MGCDIHIFAEVRKDGKWIRSTDEIFSQSEWEQEYSKKEKTDVPFDWRSYSMFAFLAGVRNYDHCEPISEPRGLPNDSEYLNEEENDGWVPMSRLEEIKNSDYHSRSYLTLKELLDFDYTQTFWNRRITRKVGNTYYGAALAEEGEGEIITYRDNLGEWFFTHLKELGTLGAPEDVRIVFYFDN